MAEMLRFSQPLFYLGILKMPMPKPNEGEEQSKFVSRCISFETKAGQEAGRNTSYVLPSLERQE